MRAVERVRCGPGHDRGSVTVEFALALPVVAVVLTVGIAGVLVAVMRSGEVQAILTDLVRTALTP